jgi:hypothetical protein
MFYGATYRTVRALVGAVCRKPGTLTVPARNEELEDDITGQGVSLEEFVKQVTGEIFLCGRGGILVDRTKDGSQPYFSFYNAENIVNWGEDDVRKFVVLREVVFVTDDPADPYKVEAKTQFREILLNKSPDETQQTVQVRVWKQKLGVDGKLSASYVIVDDTLLKKRSGNLNSFPFIFVSPDSRSNKIEKPPLQDLVNVNVSHWRNSVDLEYGRHILGLPTPYMTGVDATNKEPVALGPGSCIKLSDPGAKFGFAEFTGAGLAELRLALSEKEELMATLGARILSSQAAATETAETAKIHAAGEDNALSSIVNGVEEAIEAGLEIAIEWDGGDPATVEYEMSRDFTNIRIDAQTLTALLAVVQANKMSIESFLWNIQQGELLAPGVSIDDEMQKIETQKQEAADLQAELFAKAGGAAATGFGARPGGSAVGKNDPKKAQEDGKGGVPSAGAPGAKQQGSGSKAQD